MIPDLFSKLRLLALLLLPVFSLACWSESAAEPSVENACQLFTPVDYSQLHTRHLALPNPFLRANGEVIHSQAQWACKRSEIEQQAEHYMLGEKPSDTLTASASLQDDQLLIKLGGPKKNLQFYAPVSLPAMGKAPYPVMIGMGRNSLNTQALSDAGIALIQFPNNLLAEQQNAGSRGKGLFYEYFGEGHSAGALIAWAWGVSRLIDALENNQDLPFDPRHIALTGCSRNGKGAIIASAFDERISLTIAQEAGAGGVASWRVSEANLAAGENVQTLRQIVTENVWFSSGFAKFSESVDLLPFDQHQIMGLIAPRALLIIDNAIDWLGIESSYTAALAAKTQWQALGVPEAFGMSQTTAHPHCQQPASQQAAINQFVARYLLDSNQKPETVLDNENQIKVDTQRWMPWSVPSLTAGK